MIVLPCIRVIRENHRYFPCTSCRMSGKIAKIDHLSSLYTIAYVKRRPSRGTFASSADNSRSSDQPCVLQWCSMSMTNVRCTANAMRTHNGCGFPCEPAREPLATTTRGTLGGTNISPLSLKKVKRQRQGRRAARWICLTR